MIILDTNVVSEPLKPTPAPAVVAWLNQQAAETLYLTTINLAELLAGVEAMPAGKRRSALHRALGDKIFPLFEGRILSFDKKAAEAFAHIHAQAEAAGNSMSFADTAIAAIALAHGYIVATRNERDFRSTGVKIINPWKVS